VSAQQENRNDSVTQHEGSIANVTRVHIDLGATTIVIVISLMVIIGACGVVMGLNLAKQAELDRQFLYMERQEALKERRLMDMEAYALLNGWKRPGDDTFGPTGNVERMTPKHK
jgi:hypothetical protein